MNDYSLLEKLCAIHAPSGSEYTMAEFIYNYIELHKHTWKTIPKIYKDDEFQDAIVLVFGSPRTALYAHVDTVGYTVGYNSEIIPIGSPQPTSNTILVGKDALGDIACKIVFPVEHDERLHDEKLRYSYSRDIARGTTLTFKPSFVEDETYIYSPFIDNRAGVWVALKVAEQITDGAIVFSTYEEHKGGSVQFIQRFLYETYKVRQALISDITWVTNGVHFGKGCAVSLRDSYIPRKLYLQKVLAILQQARLPHQLEVEQTGGSDGSYLQQSPYPIDWCFVGAPQESSHSPLEKINKEDLESMRAAHTALMKNL